MTATLKQKAYRAICEKVIRGELLPGNRISELAIAKQLGISRSPVREAISQLASEGLVTLIPDAGSFVRKFTRAEIEHLFQFREWLEAKAIEEAMERIGAEEFQRLRSYCDEVLAVAREHRESGEKYLAMPGYWRWLKADFCFHFSIVRAAGNSLVLKTIASQYFISNCLNGYVWQHTLADLVYLYRQHRRILRALGHKNVAFAQQMIAEHAERGRRHAIELLERQGVRHGFGTIEEEGDWLAALHGLVEGVMEDRGGSSPREPR